MNFLELIPVPPKTTFNIGLTSPRNADMIAALGHPVKNGLYKPDGSCTQPNAPAFLARIATEDLGPFRATGLKPALASLRGIFARVKAEVPELHALLGTEGMLCARFTKIRKPGGGLKIGPGISNHSWGTAIDVKLAGHLDKQGNQLTQRGLLILSTYFNAAGWYWGAAFPTEDAMHFEVSKSLLARWKQSGML
jgi:hypothetical protein